MNHKPRTAPRLRSGQANHGFTLVEIVVSLMIILAAVAGIFAGFVATQKYVSRSKRRGQVINYVRQELDTLKTHIRKDTWDNDPEDTAIPQNKKNFLYAPQGQSRTYTAKTAFPNLRNYSDDALVYTVSAAADTAATAYRTVSITAKWVEPK